MKAIIISGPPAVGKTTVAKALAEELGLKMIGGGDLLKELAEREGMDARGEDWWDKREGMKFLERRMAERRFDEEADRMLIEFAEKGDVVITSYTLPWLYKGGIKIWLHASKEERARRMAKRDGISYEEALRIVEERDRRNSELYKRLYGIEFGPDPDAFDFIIRTDGIDKDKVVKISCELVKLLLK